jgi:hypothetical protein
VAYPEALKRIFAEGILCVLAKDTVLLFARYPSRESIKQEVGFYRKAFINETRKGRCNLPSNPINRCFFCKSEPFTENGKLAENHAFINMVIVIILTIWASPAEYSPEGKVSAARCRSRINKER